jgi:hypothetical protein
LRKREQSSATPDDKPANSAGFFSSLRLWEAEAGMACSAKDRFGIDFAIEATGCSWPF